MKFKHYKFPPQNYPPRISFKLMIKIDEVRTGLDDHLSAEPEEPLTDQTGMIAIPEKQAGTIKSE